MAAYPNDQMISLAKGEWASGFQRAKLTRFQIVKGCDSVCSDPGFVNLGEFIEVCKSFKERTSELKLESRMEYDKAKAQIEWIKGILRG